MAKEDGRMSGSLNVQLLREQIIDELSWAHSSILINEYQAPVVLVNAPEGQREYFITDMVEAQLETYSDLLRSVSLEGYTEEEVHNLLMRYLNRESSDKWKNLVKAHLNIDLLISGFKRIVIETLSTAPYIDSNDTMLVNKLKQEISKVNDPHELSRLFNDKDYAFEELHTFEVANKKRLEVKIELYTVLYKKLENAFQIWKNKMNLSDYLLSSENPNIERIAKRQSELAQDDFYLVFESSLNDESNIIQLTQLYVDKFYPDEDLYSMLDRALDKDALIDVLKENLTLMLATTVPYNKVSREYWGSKIKVLSEIEELIRYNNEITNFVEERACNWEEAD